MKSIWIASLLALGGAHLSAHAQFQCGEAPPYTEEQLAALPEWAAGGAFNQFAELAGADFDFESYRADCPNWAIFGYGLHSGPACLHGVDVSSLYVSAAYVFEKKLARDPAEFRNYYWSEAVRRGFIKYLTPRSPVATD